MYRDLNTQNFLNVRYSSIEIQKTLHASRKTLLSTAHFTKYSDDSAEATRVSRDFVFETSDCRIDDLTFVMIII